MKLLNLGCGTRYHSSWTNIDFTSEDKNIIEHNLIDGIPFDNQTFDVLYHSHVLEHFSKRDGETFLRECHRVLKVNGIMRIAVPDLEVIAHEYLENLNLALKGDQNAAHNYNWIKLEMYDQTVRNQGGGDMGKYLFQEKIPNEEYVFKRLGQEAFNIRNLYLESLKDITPISVAKQSYKDQYSFRYLKNKISNSIRLKLKNYLFKLEIEQYKRFHIEAEIGRFRLGGEIHQWMYDRYSLSLLLKKIGFTSIEVKDPFTSNIKDWNTFELESKDGLVHKPDSLFMEAVKLNEVSDMIYGQP